MEEQWKHRWLVIRQRETQLKSLSVFTHYITEVINHKMASYLHLQLRHVICSYSYHTWAHARTIILVLAK